jgi:hypothetical protein
MREWQPRERSSGVSGRGGEAKHCGKPPVRKRMVGMCRTPLTAILATKYGKTDHWSQDCKNPKEQQMHLMAQVCALNDIVEKESTLE